jgi:hypothetical protein
MKPTKTASIPPIQLRKPASTIRVHGIPPKPLIYFAGKISKHDWREAVLGAGRPGAVNNDSDSNMPELWNPCWHNDCVTFFYGGPFFVACDHGCGHRLNAHGANGGLTSSTCINDDIAELHQKVWDTNGARILLANLVFAYINEVDCFGTLVEIGIAAASNKAIFLALGPDLSNEQCADLWMAQTAAIRVYHGTAEFAWQAFCRDLDLANATS